MAAMPFKATCLVAHYHSMSLKDFWTFKLPRLFGATGDGYLLGQARGQEFRNGFFDHSAQLWNEAGTLLATSHQIVYYKE